jgi:acetyl-CoA carboxylase beta subunit
MKATFGFQICQMGFISGAKVADVVPYAIRDNFCLPAPVLFIPRSTKATV